MYKKAITTIGCILAILVFCRHGYAADTSLGDEAQKQLASQGDTFERERRRLSLKEEKKPEIVVEEQKKPPPKKGAGPPFLLKKIIIEDNALCSQKELDPILAPYENIQSSFESLQAAAQVVSNYLRAKGFLTSRAYLAPQKIENGTVILKILEGKIGKIKAENNRYFKKSLYTDSIHLKKDRLFDYSDLENSMYFLNRKPDRTAKAYLIAGEEPDTSDLVLKADETYPVHAHYDFNNHGTKFTHLGRNAVGVDHNNLTGNGDTFSGSVMMAEQKAFDGGFIAYDLPLESTGTTIHLNTSYVKTLLVGDLKPFEIKGSSFNFTPGVTQTFYKKATALLEGYFRFEIKDSKTTISDTKINFDRARAAVFGPRFTFQDAGGRTIFSSDLHWGIPNFLGSADETDLNASRVNSGGDFLYYTGSIARVQRIPPESVLILRAGGQWTRDTLTSLEQVRGGGSYSVRGYPESDSSGDYGYNWSMEVDVPLTFLSKRWKIPYNNRYNWRDSVRLVGFLEGANTYLRERQQETDIKDRFLLGTGFGLRFNIGETLSLQVDLGYPIGDRSNDKNRKQFHISLQSGF